MAKTFSQMKTNVGNFVQDTSSDMATLIGRWINDHYRKLSRRGKFSGLIDFDYTFQTVVGTSEYALPEDFEQEIFVGNITDGLSLSRKNEGEWFTDRIDSFNDETLQNGKSSVYVILESTSKIKLDPPPDSIVTIAMPYKRTVTDMVGDTETILIKDAEVIVEFGAIAEALAYKKQYQKADYYFQREETEYNNRVMQEKAKINTLLQRVSSGYRVGNTGRLTGDVPYAA